MSNVLVTGCLGQLGSEIMELTKDSSDSYIYTDKNELDITKIDEIEMLISLKKIDTIINCAAYTAVDKAETDQEIAHLINAKSTQNLAQIAKQYNCKLVHVSTDYVFDGTNHKPYVETDSTNPNGLYGATKLDGEKMMQEINPANSIIIRTSWVYSSHGVNFVKTMLKLGKERDNLTVIYDQVGTPTYAKDLAQVILDIIPQLDNQDVEIYHYSNEGVLSWYDFAKEIMKMAKLECNIAPIETKDYPTPAKRPHYSLLNKAKIKNRYNISIPYWKDSLNECLIKMGERK
jgi:dTDP-4-dehydrorhamnose reductase